MGSQGFGNSQRFDPWIQPVCGERETVRYVSFGTTDPELDPFPTEIDPDGG
jgi:hypothetical protein